MKRLLDLRPYNEQLQDSGDMPKIKIVNTGPSKNGGSRVIIAPAREYDEIINSVPYGELTTFDSIKSYLAKKYNADYTCPVTSRKFIALVAYASIERGVDETPFWRTLKKDGELNKAFPEGVEMQKRLLEMEGHRIIQSGSRYYVENYRNKLHNLGVATDEAAVAQSD